MGTLPNETGDLMTKDMIKAKVINAFFVLVFNGDHWENLGQERLTLGGEGSG